MEGESDFLRSIATDWLGIDVRPRLVVAPDRTVHWINQSARDILAHVPTVQLLHDRLSFRSVGDEDQFDAFLNESDREPRTTAFAFDGGSSHLLFRGHYLVAAKVVCVELALDHAAYRPALADFDKVFGLTSSEAKTAAALFHGQSVTDVAALHKVSVDTVRTHVRQIYAKLGTGNREQFFRRLQPYRIT